MCRWPSAQRTTDSEDLPVDFIELAHDNDNDKVNLYIQFVELLSCCIHQYIAKRTVFRCGLKLSCQHLGLSHNPAEILH